MVEAVLLYNLLIKRQVCYKGGDPRNMSVTVLSEIFQVFNLYLM